MALIVATLCAGCTKPEGKHVANEQTPFTIEQLAMLAKVDRDMDSGKQPYVYNRGERSAFSDELLNRFNIKSGQSVSDSIITKLTRAALKEVQQQIRERKSVSL